MIKSSFNGIKISGICAAVPDNYVSLEECAESKIKSGEFNLAKYVKSTGVTGKYICKENQTPSDLCVAAAERLIAEKGIDRNEIGVLVYVTQSPDYNRPATACVMQHRLGLSTACVAFDVNLGCSGFCYGVNVVASLLNSSNSKNALLLCGDLSAQTVDREYKDVDVCNLFGDSGCAVLVEKTDSDNDTLSVYSATDGSGYKCIISYGEYARHPEMSGDIFMDGIEVFNFAVDRAPEMLKAYMADMGTTPDDYDKLVLHQANIYIMKQVTKRCGFPPEKMAVSIDKFANTSSVSIPLTIANDYGEDNSDSEKRLLTCGFGIGLSWGVVEFSIAPKDVLPVIYTNEWFDDGITEDR